MSYLIFLVTTVKTLILHCTEGKKTFKGQYTLLLVYYSVYVLFNFRFSVY